MQARSCALYRGGRQPEASGVYQRLRTELLDQFGLEPGLDLCALQAQILERAPSLDLQRSTSNRGPRAPEGTIAVLFTDIEGSTRLATGLGDVWGRGARTASVDRREAIAEEGGFVRRSDGGAFFATFTDARAGARAALAGMRSLRAHEWPETVGELRVTMGLHVGHVQRTAAATWDWRCTVRRG